MRLPCLVLLLSSLVASGASAQTAAQNAALEPDEPRPTTGKGASEHIAVTGWFVAPTLGTTTFSGRVAYLPGLRGGVYLNRRVAIGLTASGIGGADTYVSENDLGNFATYGGFLLQYVVTSTRAVHATFESTFASGRWCAYTGNDAGRLGCSGKDFLVLEPAAAVELDVARHLRVATGLGYRFAAAGRGEGPSSASMSGVALRLALMLGTF
jgi:hypothetical protein